MFYKIIGLKNSIKHHYYNLLIENNFTKNYGYQFSQQKVQRVHLICIYFHKKSQIFSFTFPTTLPTCHFQWKKFRMHFIFFKFSSMPWTSNFCIQRSPPPPERRNPPKDGIKRKTMWGPSTFGTSLRGMVYYSYYSRHSPWTRRKLEIEREKKIKNFLLPPFTNEQINQ